MTQPFWEVELAKKRGELINSALDYSSESRTASTFATRPFTPSRTAWHPPPPMARPAQTYTPAYRSTPIVFREPATVPQSARVQRPTWQQTGTTRAPAAHTASDAGGVAGSDGLLLDLGARLQSLKQPPGWFAALLITLAGYVGGQLRQPETPPAQASATKHQVALTHAKGVKAR